MWGGVEELWPPEKASRNAKIVRKRSAQLILPATVNHAEELPNKDGEDLGEIEVPERSARTAGTLSLLVIIHATYQHAWGERLFLIEDEGLRRRRGTRDTCESMFSL